MLISSIVSVVAATLYRIFNNYYVQSCKRYLRSTRWRLHVSDHRFDVSEPYVGYISNSKFGHEQSLTSSNNTIQHQSTNQRHQLAHRLSISSIDDVHNVSLLFGD